MSFISEFKEFAMKGNLIDMAVGVVMGASFGQVSSSFIDGMFMPIVGKIFQVGNLKDTKLVLSEAVKEGDKIVTPEAAIAYGSFISALLNFLIVAFVMFMIIKGINKMKKAEAAAPAAPAAPPAQEVLLAEIRDLLKR
jgi:large conductance mechanosensitive channel